MLELLKPPSREGGSDWPSLGQVSTLVQSVVARGGVLQQTGFLLAVGLRLGRLCLCCLLPLGKPLRGHKSTLISGMTSETSSVP